MDVSDMKLSFYDSFLQKKANIVILKLETVKK